MAFVRPRDTAVPKVGKAWEPFVYPNSTNYHNTCYIFFVVFFWMKIVHHEVLDKSEAVADEKPTQPIDGLSNV